jgi:hypothetical protein
MEQTECFLRQGVLSSAPLSWIARSYDGRFGEPSLPSALPPLRSIEQWPRFWGRNDLELIEQVRAVGGYGQAQDDVGDDPIGYRGLQVEWRVGKGPAQLRRGVDLISDIGEPIHPGEPLTRTRLPSHSTGRRAGDSGPYRFYEQIKARALPLDRTLCWWLREQRRG